MTFICTCRHVRCVKTRDLVGPACASAVMQACAAPTFMWPGEFIRAYLLCRIKSLCGMKYMIKDLNIFGYKAKMSKFHPDEVVGRSNEKQF